MRKTLATAAAALLLAGGFVAVRPMSTCWPSWTCYQPEGPCGFTGKMCKMPKIPTRPPVR